MAEMNKAYSGSVQDLEPHTMNHGSPPPSYGYGPPPAQYGHPGMHPPQHYGHPSMQSHGQQQSSTTVIVQQPVETKNPLMLGVIHGTRAWSTSLCDCFSDPGNCFFTMCCYQYALCQLASRTGECLCTPQCVPATELVLRTRIRTLGGIRGSICSDFCTVCLCFYCAACQESRELTLMGVP